MVKSGMKSQSTPGRRFYEEQIALLQQGRVDELIEKHYADDAVLVSFSKVVRGRSALKAHFGDYVKLLEHLEIVSLDQFVEAEDAILFEATVRTALGQASVYDAFVLRNGKATHHFTGTK